MAAYYSTDSDLEVYIPDILDLGLPESVENGLVTKIDGDFAAGEDTFAFQDVTGLVAGEFFRIGTGSSAEILTVESVTDNDVTFTADSRKVHKTNSKAEQVITDGFAADHLLAKSDIDKQLDVRWFRGQVGNRNQFPVFRTTNILFDPDLMLNASSELATLSTYWVLGYYVFPKLARRKPGEDYYATQAKDFQARAEGELNIILARGVSYDWDASGVLDDFEKNVPSMGFKVRRG